MGGVNQYGGTDNFGWGVSPPLFSQGVAWPSPFLAVQPSCGGCGRPRPWYRVLWEELLVAAFEDVHLRIVEAGVDIDGPISFPDETAPRTNRGVGIRAGHATRWA